MRYTIIIQPITDEKVAKLLARNIASRTQSLSFTELTEVLRNEEYTFAQNIKKDELNHHKQFLDENGITYSTIAQPEEPPQVVTEKVVPVHEKTHEKRERDTKPQITHTIPQVPQTKSASAAKKVIPITLIIFVILFSILINIAGKSEKENRFDISQGTISKSSTSRSGSAPSTEPNNTSPGSPEFQSREYSDSADQKCGHDGHDAERLYRFAISYNPQNIDAWFGLLNCYRSIKKENEALKVEKEMKSTFGPKVLIPEEFTKKFGIKEVLQTKEGAVSFVYKTDTPLNELYSDLFQISRRFNSLGKYHTLTILSKRKDGSGIFMTLALGNCVTYRDFIDSGTFEEL